MIIVRPYSLWPVRSASELLLAAVIWPYFRKVILYYIEEPQFYRYTLQYTILRREKGGKIARHVRRHVNKRLSLNYYNERRSTYTHRVAEWNHDDNDDIIVVVVHCCFFFFFCYSYIIVYFLSLVHYVKCEAMIKEKKKDDQWGNIVGQEWRDLFWWPFVIFTSIIIDIKITFTHVPFLGYLFIVVK